MGKTRKQEPLPVWVRPKQRFRRKLGRFFLHLLGWTGIAVLYYIAFSFFFDTPAEYAMKTSTRKLEQEYGALAQRYDSLSLALDNIVERDRNVFKILFESEPYDFTSEAEAGRITKYEKLLDSDINTLSKDLVAKTGEMEKKLTALVGSYEKMQDKLSGLGTGADFIPSIQPIINPDLTLLTASYGMRIHPFYKTLSSHQGVDFTIPENSRVFATADGTVKDIINRRSSSGTTLIIDHGNGYETHYSHLNKTNARKGQKVRKGDIIALSGNTGLSLAPHLHYEVWYKGMRVNPIYYFFMELSPAQYQRMLRIAESGMQSFD